MTCLALAALTLSGCATMSTAYHPRGLTGGYTDTKLADDRYKIWFGGNSYSNSQMALDFAVLRGAELCQQAGYTYFAITSNTQKSEQSSVYVSTGGYSGFIPSGIKPIAEIEVQCQPEAGAETKSTADTIARIREAYAKNMPKA